jgi:hypothetical protein
MMLVVAVVCALLVVAPYAASAPIPGLQGGVGRGWSIISENMRAPIYQFTYEYGGSFKNPIDGITYDVPDQVCVCVCVCVCVSVCVCVCACAAYVPTVCTCVWL